MDIDNFDRRILYSLDEDSSKSLTKISQELDTTPQLVKYRLERLEKNGFIQAYWPMIEFRNLRNSNASYFLKLKNLSTEKEREIYAYLKSQNNIIIVMRGDGYWDLHLTIATRNIFASVAVFNKFYDRFHQSIANYDTAISVGFYQFRREYLNPRATKKEYPPMALTGADVQEIKFSELQLQILEALNQNCRQSLSDIAEKIGVKRDTVVYNFNKISKTSIIQSHALLLDHDKLGWPRYRALLQVTDFTSVKFKDFFSYCQRNPNIIHLLRLFGNWQALIDIEIESREKLRDLFRDMMQKYGDIILRVESTHVYKTDKFRDIPLKISK
ncbi:MAG: Lrp/AsnC family transcriptional regulator [Parcubacteria group bacterium]|jgi:DNA-binding Lrp family transcriptional regulator